MAFDVEGARKAGYTDAEIADFLGAESKFDVSGARQAGYSDGDIIGHLVPAGIKKSEPPRPSVGESFMRGLGLGTRNIIEGVGQIPGMLYDAARLPGRAITAGVNALAPTQQTTTGLVTGQAPQPAWQIPSGYSSHDILTGVSDAIGLPKPETPGERIRGDIGSNVASLIPSMGAGAVIKGTGRAGEVLGNALMSAPWSQIFGAAGAGAAGGVAREQGAGPAAQFGASLAGGITGAAVPGALSLTGRALSSAIQPFSQEGRERILAEALLRNSSDPETLATRLRTGADNADARLPGSPVTSAVAARDPQLGVLENGLRSDAQAVGGLSPAAAIRDVEAQRNSVRQAMIDNLKRGEATNATARGDTLRDALLKSEDAMGARTNQLFDIARDRSTARLPVESIAERTKSALSVFDPARGGAGVPAELQSVLDDIGKLGTLNVDQAQNIRSRLGDIAGRASVAGDNRLASAAGAVSSAIEQGMSDPRWMAAVGQRRAQGAALGRDAAGSAATGAVLRTDKYGAPMLTSDQAINKALSSPQAARQTLEAGYKALEDARAARMPTAHIEELAASVRAMRQSMRDQFADMLQRASSTTSTMADAAGNVSTQLSPAQFSRWWRDNKGVADVLFDGKERQALDRLAADFAETTLSNQARARGSDTAQNLSVGNFIARLTGGVVDPQNPLAQTLASVGPVARWIYQSPEAAMREMLVHAIRDPKFAAQLVEKATPDSLQRAVLYFNQTMPERVRDAAVGALAREVPRSLTNPTRDQGQLPRPTGR